MTLVGLLPQVLFVLGLGFLVANVRAAIDLARWARRRPGALAVWAPPKPPFYAMSLAIGGAMGRLLLSALFVPRPLPALFGEFMMFVYYAGVVPLSTRIARGLYADGIQAESGFMPYAQIGGLRWQDGESILVVASRLRTLARRPAGARPPPGGGAPAAAREDCRARHRHRGRPGAAPGRTRREERRLVPCERLAARG